MPKYHWSNKIIERFQKINEKCLRNRRPNGIVEVSKVWPVGRIRRTTISSSPQLILESHINPS